MGLRPPTFVRMSELIQKRPFCGKPRRVRHKGQNYFVSSVGFCFSVITEKERLHPRWRHHRGKIGGIFNFWSWQLWIKAFMIFPCHSGRIMVSPPEDSPFYFLLYTLRYHDPIAFNKAGRAIARQTRHLGWISGPAVWFQHSFPDEDVRVNKNNIYTGCPTKENVARNVLVLLCVLLLFSLSL